MTWLIGGALLVVGIALGFLLSVYYVARFFTGVAVGVAQKARASLSVPEPAAALVEPPQAPAALPPSPPPATEPEHPDGVLDTRWTLFDRLEDGSLHPVLGLSGETAEERERVKVHPGPKYDRVQRSFR